MATTPKAAITKIRYRRTPLVHQENAAGHHEGSSSWQAQSRQIPCGARQLDAD